MKALKYGCGQFGGNIINMMFVGWIMYFYANSENGNKPLVSISVLGAALVIGRGLDAFFDPTIGYWSDNLKSRMGRRRPFIIFGTPPLVLCFILLFNPLFPAGSMALTVSTIIIITVFWFCFTAVMGPYLGLLPEIAETTAERVSLSTTLAVGQLLATAYQGILAPKIIDTWGYQVTAIFSGILAFIFLYITAFGIKEKHVFAETTSSHAEYSFKDAFLWTFKNKPFIVYIAASVFQYLGFAALTASIPFIVTRLMNKPASYVSVLYLVSIPGFVISFFLVNKLAKKFDKAMLYKICLILLAIFFPVLYLFGRVNLGIDTAIAGLIFMGLMTFPIAGNSVLPMAILSDIVDYDEKLTGQRREAMYFGMQGLLQKLATALSTGMSAILFGMFGYSMDNHLGVNLLGPVAGFFGFIGFVIFAFYPLDEKTCELKKKAVHG